MSCYPTKVGDQEGEWREGEREGRKEKKGKSVRVQRLAEKTHCNDQEMIESEGER